MSTKISGKRTKHVQHQCLVLGIGAALRMLYVHVHARIICMCTHVHVHVRITYGVSHVGRCRRQQLKLLASVLPSKV